jgi:hypothetical protein
MTDCRYTYNTKYVDELDRNRAKASATKGGEADRDAAMAAKRSEQQAIIARQQSDSVRNKSDYLSRQIEAARGSIADVLNNPEPPNTIKKANPQGTTIYTGDATR